MRAYGLCTVLLVFAVPVFAQQPAAPTPQKSISSYLGLHTFPAKNQLPARQKQDEMACYGWAKRDSSFDPLAALAARQSATPPPATQGAHTQGAGAKGAARGAAGGAVVGAISGNAAKGAEIGAAAGAVRGRLRARRAKKKQEKKAQQQSQQQAQAKAQTQQKLDSFKKAFSACMEGKGYVVK